MKQIRRIALFALVLSPLFALALYFTGFGQHRCPICIDGDTTDQIKLGITEAEVEKILGGPAGNYQTRPAKAFFINDPSYFCGYRVVPFPPYAKKKVWTTDEKVLWVYFDPQGKVVTHRNDSIPQ